MSERRLALIAALAAVIALSGVLLGLDRIIAEAVASHGSWRIWGIATGWLEIVFGFHLSRWTTGAALLLALACFILRKFRAARVLALVGCVDS